MSSMAGVRVCMVRLPGSRQLTCAGSSEKAQPRFCNRMPVPVATMPEPNS